MLFCTFNHGGLIHLGFNMYALYTLSNGLQFIFTPENFVAFYLSAGKFIK